MDTEKRTGLQRVGCFGWLAIIAVIIVAISVLISWNYERSNPPETDSTYGPSESLLLIKCERAIAPDKVANYQVINTGDNVYVVSGQTGAGARFHCAYKWSGGDNLALIESGVGNR